MDLLYCWLKVAKSGGTPGSTKTIRCDFATVLAKCKYEIVRHLELLWNLELELQNDFFS